MPPEPLRIHGDNLIPPQLTAALLTSDELAELLRPALIEVLADDVGDIALAVAREVRCA